MLYDITIDGKNYRLELERAGGAWRCRLDGKAVNVDAVLARPDILSILIDGEAHEIKRERGADETNLWVGSARYSVEVRDPRSFRGRRAAGENDQGPKKLVASMPGKVVRVLAQEKEEVDAGQGILVVEAMKMQNEVKSPKKGTVQRIVAREGTSVNAGEVLAIVE